MFQDCDIKRFDWMLLGTALALSLLGIALLYGLANWAPAWRRLPKRQMQWLCISMIAVLIVISFDYMRWRRISYLLYGLTLLALLLLPVFGHTENNSTRWFRMGTLSVQPSEFAKIAFVLALARYLMYRKNYRTLRGFAAPFLFALVPMGLILIQPDLGTAMLFLPTLFIMLFVAGASIKHLVAVGIAGMACAPLMWLKMGAAQKARIIGFLWPERDPAGAGWHVMRSVAATISGGITGNGFSSGSPILRHRGFKAFNDFIFAAASHEFGFVGALCILVLFLIFFTRGAEIAEGTRNPFGRLVAVGMLTMLGVQVLVNIGMTIRLCPITGMTLPFMSQGGSSLVVCFVMVGFILNIGMRRKHTLAPEDFS